MASDDDRKKADDKKAEEAKKASDARDAAIASSDEAAKNEPPPNSPLRSRDPAVREAAKNPQARNTVNVTCRLPHGLVLRLYDMVEGDDGKKIPIPQEREFTLAGANAGQLYTGFGITPVPTDFWEAWLQQNKGLPALRNGLLFAEPTRERAIDHAADNAQARTGVEPIDPNRPGPGLAPATARERQEEAQAAGRR